MEKVYGIVLAGGSGKRMGGDTPKQLMDVLGRPMLYYSLNAFERSRVDEVVLVAPAGEEASYEENIVKRFAFSKVKAVVAGGAERAESVYHGLQALSDDGYVLVHDGARPCVTTDIISDLIDGAVKYRAAIACMPTKDTVKVADEHGFVGATPTRESIFNVQTPQAFETSLLKAAYAAAVARDGDLSAALTDDSMVVERYEGTPVKLVMASYENIKVTTAEDLLLATEILKRRGF